MATSDLSNYQLYFYLSLSLSLKLKYLYLFRFKWNVEKLKPHFNITPINGYCSPGSEILFACTFKPICQSNLIQAEVKKMQLLIKIQLNLHNFIFRLSY